MKFPRANPEDENEWILNPNFLSLVQQKIYSTPQCYVHCDLEQIQSILLALENVEKEK